MAIKSTRYVRITSGVIGAQSAAQRALTGRRFSTNPRVPVGEVVSVASGGAEDLFGAASDEAAFARQYFGYVSPAPASQASSLQFAPYAPTGRAPAVFGRSAASTLAQLQAIVAGVLAVRVNGAAAVQVPGINLSAATSFADVALAVTTAVQAAGGALANIAFSYDAPNKEFSAVGDTVGEGRLEFTPTDLSGLLGLTGLGAIVSPGSDPQTPLEAFLAAEAVTDSFGSASFAPDASVTHDALVPVAEYVAGENVKYQFYVSVGPEDDLQTVAAQFDAIASTGLILNGTAGEYKEALPMAIMAATNYDRRNATVSYMFRQAAFTPDVESDSVANVLDPLRINYYGRTASAGQTLDFFQRGFLGGVATSIRDMGAHANEQWLKAFLSARLLSTQVSLGKIPANADGEALIGAALLEAVQQAKDNGTISADSSLTALQESAIRQISNDSDDAVRNVGSVGYWIDVRIVPETGASQLTEYVVLYTLIYRKMDTVRRIDGSHNLV